MMAQVPSGMPAPGSASGGPAAATVNCPQCAHVNSPSNLFCSSCGYRLTPGAAKLPATVAEKAAPIGGVLLTALRADGTEAGSYDLPGGGNATIGRDTGSIFSSDSYLSPRHATFRQAGGKLFLKDEASLNGVYKKLSRDMPVEVRPNDVFRIGQEIVRYEVLEPPQPSPDGVERLGASPKGFAGRLALVTGRDTTGNAFLVPDVGMHMGRERGEVLFPEDGYVSGLHCRLAFEGPRLFLTDLGSSNGTFVRLREETEVVSGDILLMGQQLFRVTA
jgi:pSer/pThr/pTyr-binding forkhead associated (FHA) protein